MAAPQPALAGIRVLEVGGFGGCPFAPGASGNITTEELVYLLEDSGVSPGLDLDALLRAAGRLPIFATDRLTSSGARRYGHRQPMG